MTRPQSNAVSVGRKLKSSRSLSGTNGSPAVKSHRAGSLQIHTRRETTASASHAQSSASKDTSKSTPTEFPSLPLGWEWQVRQVGGTWAACLFTWEYDCIVEVLEGGSLRISTGIAPLEVVQAVIKANSRIPQ